MVQGRSIRVFLVPLVLLAAQALLTSPGAAVAANEANERREVLAPPSARCCMGFTYVPAPIRKVIMYGGLDTNGDALKDTWAWNGTSWQPLIADSAPGPRVSTRMVYDVAIDRVVLFGGKACMTCAPVDDKTWLFNASTNTWTECACSGLRPLKRTSPGLSYDSVNQLVILFGGTGGGGPRNDTWKFNGTSWAECITECPVASRPSARGGPEMEFDPVLGETVMFGGQSGSGSLGDTWFFNPTQNPAWEQCSPTGQCAVNPGPRSGHRMAYEGGPGQRIFLFGAGNPTLKNDTWFWMGNPNRSWVQCDASNGCSATPPAPRCCTGLTYDGARAEIVLFGGGINPAPSAYGDFWRWTAAGSWDCIPATCST